MSSFTFQKLNGFSSNINHVWFGQFTKYFENNPLNHFSCALIRFRNLSLLAHLVRLLFVAIFLVFFSIFRFHRELLIAFGIDEVIIIVGFYAILKINEFVLKTYRYLLIGNFFFKVIMVWADLFSSLILSIIFQWKAEILEFIILQVVFLIFDMAPAYSIFLLYQNEIGNCKVETHHLIAEMVFKYFIYRRYISFKKKRAKRKNLRRILKFH